MSEQEKNRSFDKKGKHVQSKHALPNQKINKKKHSKRKPRKNRTFNFANAPQAIDWLNHQHNQTLSIKYAIQLAIGLYGNTDLADACMDENIALLPVMLARKAQVPQNGMPLSPVNNVMANQANPQAMQKSQVAKPKAESTSNAETKPASRSEKRTDLNQSRFTELFNKQYGEDDK